MIKTNCTLEWNNEPPVLTAIVSGEIDHHGALTLRQDTDSLIRELRPSVLILDMSRISFMDSSGLGYIMGRYEMMKKTNGTVSVRSPSPCVTRMLKLTGFEKKIKII